MEFWHQFFMSFNPDTEGASFMWVILLFMVLSIAMAAERFFYIMVRSNVNSDKFMMEIRKYVTSGNIKRAIELCEAGKHRALPYVVMAGLKKVQESESLDFRCGVIGPIGMRSSRSRTAQSRPPFLRPRSNGRRAQLAYGPAVEVLAPPELRAMVVQWLDAAARKYDHER